MPWYCYELRKSSSEKVLMRYTPISITMMILFLWTAFHSCTDFVRVQPAHSNLQVSPHRRHVYKWRFKINTSQQQQPTTNFKCFTPMVHSRRQKTERDGKLHGANVAVLHSINASIEVACFWRCYYTSLQNHTVSVTTDVPTSEVHASAVLVRLDEKKLRRLRYIERHNVHAKFCDNQSRGSKHGWLKITSYVNFIPKKKKQKRRLKTAFRISQCLRR